MIGHTKKGDAPMWLDFYQSDGKSFHDQDDPIIRRWECIIQRITIPFSNA